MIKFLQINIGVCKAAQELAMATANEIRADVLIISEQHRNRDEDCGWYSDVNSRAAIAILSDISIDKIGPPSPGFRWLEIKGYRVYSCYISPNVNFLEFEGFLARLEASVRGANCPVVIAGDFNSKSPEWGSPKEDPRGRALADMLAALGLVVCNEGNKPTFVRGASESHLDITLITQTAVTSITGWKILDEESLNLHKYIMFDVNAPRGYQQIRDKKGWAYRKLDYAKLYEKLSCGAPTLPDDVGSACNQVVAWLTETCDACMPRAGGSPKRRPIFWWNEGIAEQRRICLKARRLYTRKRKKAGESGSISERENFKQQRKELTLKIIDAKDKKWNELCAKVDADPWGIPYKIVMKTLSRRKPIPGLEIPGRLNTIVNTLFPRRPISVGTSTTVSNEELELYRFTDVELKAAARGLPGGKAPGPDGIPNEVLKMAVKMYPSYFAEIFNLCIKHASFPSEWKTARLVLLHKPGRPLDDPSAYRPLCMLDTTSKLFEKLITLRLREHLRDSGQQSVNQYGFRPGKSTVDAMARLQTIIENSKGRTSAYNKFVGMLTLDVKNAFNSASWDSILGALVKAQTPKYLQNILGQYLNKRHIIFNSTDGTSNIIEVSCGVPQGSVLGPDLWNVMYDGLLEIKLPEDTEIIAFADDVAIVCTAQVPFLLEERLGVALRDVVTWMNNNGLELALQKTEAIVFTNKNVRNTMTVEFPPFRFESSKSVKYLGVHFDQKLRFAHHAELAAKRAVEAANHLTRILPNLRGAKQKTRRVLATVVTSRLLYGAPIWKSTITAGAMGHMETVYRRTMLRVACCYRTTSYDAAAVVSSMPPINLLAEERRNIYMGMDKREAREILLDSWQKAWDASEKGRWTHRLIGDVRSWYTRKHGEVPFHLTQFLTGHGCFGVYLNKYCNLATDECAQCGVSPDSPEHAIFQCDAWCRWRNEECVYLEVNDLTAENVVTIMLRSKASWDRICRLITRIMMTREEEERKIQHS